jgi:hypothetical protein
MIPARSRLLHIYDANDNSIISTAFVRRNNPFRSMLDVIHSVPIDGGKLDLRNALDALVTGGHQFGRALFETHGSTGAIYFGGQAITGSDFRGYFADRGYERIFSYLWARIYFNGCNVADAPNGWDFLDGAGSLFLKRGGGTAFAQTGLGRPIILTGHVHHFGSSTSYSLWAPGGVFTGHDVDGDGNGSCGHA